MTRRPTSTSGQTASSSGCRAVRYAAGERPRRRGDEGRPADLQRAGGYFAQMVREGVPEFEQKMLKLAEDRELDPNSD